MAPVNPALAKTGGVPPIRPLTPLHSLPAECSAGIGRPCIHQPRTPQSPACMIMQPWSVLGVPRSEFLRPTYDGCPVGFPNATRLGTPLYLLDELPPSFTLGPTSVSSSPI